MISVCIPVFNVDVRKLAETLSAQADKLAGEGIPTEIILLDDGSDEAFRKVNRTLKDLSSPSGEGTGSRLIYDELSQNIGRARIRNLFLEYAAYGHLLFLDCDLKIERGEFLQTYVEAVKHHPGEVIVGGCNYPVGRPARGRRLHWMYGSRKESRPASARRLDPNRSFMTSNFLIPAAMLKEKGFDERLSEYGHEDSLFGYELSKKGKEIIHIDNPVIHEGIETNREFLRKTEQAVKNLVYISRLTGDDQGFKDSIKLIRTAEKLRSAQLAGITRFLLNFSDPLARWALLNGCTSLTLLDIHKLASFLKEDAKKQEAGPQI